MNIDSLNLRPTAEKLIFLAGRIDMCEAIVRWIDAGSFGSLEEVRDVIAHTAENYEAGRMRVVQGVEFLRLDDLGTDAAAALASISNAFANVDLDQN
ncbi:hypothetical protein [Silvimonas soli]|uniref:hypothetical protein n=1 Tax=Silvimonas soli TaxID=2980100 RepID=UPI0024B32948|nr:hypothetical protein [Silvimonas soli]